MNLFTVGVDIGGSHISCSAVEICSGRIVKGSDVLRDVNPHDDADRIIKTWSETIKECIKACGKQICGIGIAMPGPFDYLRGISTISGVEKYEKLFGLDVTASLHASIGDTIPVLYTNDAAAFALGESSRGVASGVERVVALTLGTGFGSGFIAGGYLITQGDKVPPNGWVYNLPFEGSIADEQFTTRWFVRRYKELTGMEVKGAKEIAEQVADNQMAKQIFDEYGCRLANFVQPLCRRFNSKTVVLGGNISKAFSLFSPSLKRRLIELGEEIDFIQGNLGDKAAIIGSASLFKHKLKIDDKPLKTQLRKTEQYLLPVEKPEVKEGEYDIYPTHELGEYKIFTGYDSLASRLTGSKVVIIDGYGGVRFDLLRDRLNTSFVSLGIKPAWWSVGAAMKSEEEIEKIISPFLGGDDPLFGFRTSLTLTDLFDKAKLASINPDQTAQINIIYGEGASLSGWEGTNVYIDIPKNEIQFRANAGSIANLGSSASDSPKKMYKRFYFVDWVMLNRHKKEILQSIDIIVDGQREGEITWMNGDAMREGLSTLAVNAFRVRSWFSPGVWGGQWIKEHISSLPDAVPNYAWSFELIVPENGLIFSSDGKMLEVSFDMMMYQNGIGVVGNTCYKNYGDEFPIRMDYLDNFDGGNLSIQCHPQRDYINKNFGEVLTQEETYYILDTKDDAVVYLGFKEDIVPEEFENALTESFQNSTPLDVNHYINHLPSRKHDLFLIPPGTLHSSGRNNLVLEISTTPYIFTFKMYDWLALDLDGTPRPLNIRRAMENLCFDRKGEKVEQTLHSKPVLIEKEDDWELWHLPTHEKHSYDVHRYVLGSVVEVLTEGKCHVLNLVEGEHAEIHTEGGETISLNYAETAVVCAAAKKYCIVNKSNRPVMIVKAFMK